ncbi:MAG: bacillithiol system redox-active protein YtxJ [Bacteroidota bacterium]
MKWNRITSGEDLEKIAALSAEQPVMVFKHSTTCNISRTALDRIERSWDDNALNQPVPFYLDLLSYRSLSNQIAEDFNIEHQSPQLLLISKGKAVYEATHFDINYRELLEQVKALDVH